MIKTIFPCTLLALLACNQKSSGYHQSLTKTLKTNDKLLETPEPGDWLDEHSEKGQTFQEYLEINPISESESRNVIYLQPIGNFDSIQKEIIKQTSEYLSLFFGLRTVILKDIQDNIIPEDARRIGFSGSEQLLATHILYKVLKPQLPNDALGVMAITAKDIYPKPSWNFVFGLSSLKNRVSVTSIFRLQDEENPKLSLSRIIKISSHEISHMLSMRHCTHAVCLMNGSNHLPETDRKPNRLCSQCLAKLTWNLNINALSRAEKLGQFFKKHKLVADYELTQKDMNLLKSKYKS